MDFYIILWIFCLSIIINFCFFIIAFILKTEILTDITYAATFIILSIIIVVWKQNFSPIQIVLFVLYNLWALRLGSYLLTRIIIIKSDQRFDKLRNSFWKFGLFWILQAISVFIISLPTIFALSMNTTYFSAKFNDYLMIIIFLTLLFLIIETIADIQKFKFHFKHTSTKLFIDHGLWKDCRHPNYLGEIGFWYMMSTLFTCYFFLKNTVTNNLNYLLQLLNFLSTLYLNILLLKIIGVPLLELKQWKKLANNTDYISYLDKTSCIIFHIGKKVLLIKYIN